MGTVRVKVPVVYFASRMSFGSSRVGIKEVVGGTSAGFSISRCFCRIGELEHVCGSVRVLVKVRFSRPRLFPARFRSCDSVPFSCVLKDVRRYCNSIFPNTGGVRRSGTVSRCCGLVLGSVRAYRFRTVTRVSFPEHCFSG